MSSRTSSGNNSRNVSREAVEEWPGELEEPPPARRRLPGAAAPTPAPSECSSELSGRRWRWQHQGGNSPLKELQFCHYSPVSAHVEPLRLAENVSRRPLLEECAARPLLRVALTLLFLATAVIVVRAVRGGRGEELQQCRELLDRGAIGRDWALIEHLAREVAGRGAAGARFAGGVAGASLLKQNAILEERNAALRRELDTLLACQAICPSKVLASAGLEQETNPTSLDEPTGGSRFAFVTLLHDSPGTWDHMWETLALARAVQQFSAYPMVVLTNTTHLPDGRVDIAEGFRHLNALVLPLHKIEMPRKFSFPLNPTWPVAYWKLQIFNLTEFDKLIWMDTDAMLTRSVDWLFEQSWMWAQRDDWSCQMNQTNVCSGLMLIFPNQTDFVEMQRHAASRPTWKGGDQELISAYFSEVRGKPINLLDDEEAAFGQCLGKAPTPYRNGDGSQVAGQWSTPAFVHKSGGWGAAPDNACFSGNMSRQYFVHGKTLLNICHYHPLGAQWRSFFCQAVHRTGMHQTEADAYCDDGCWYRGRRERQGRTWQSDVDRSWCRSINTTAGSLTLGDLHVPGHPWVAAQ